MPRRRHASTRARPPLPPVLRPVAPPHGDGAEPPTKPPEGWSSEYRRRQVEKILRFPAGTMWAEMLAQAYREHAEYLYREARKRAALAIRREEMERAVQWVKEVKPG